MNLVKIVDNVNELGCRLAQIANILTLMAETQTEDADALYGVANLAQSANELAGKTAAMIDRMRDGAKDPGSDGHEVQASRPEVRQ
jgi:hypothetical protein